MSRARCTPEALRPVGGGVVPTEHALHDALGTTMFAVN
jgi:hypothetical protein